MRLAGSVAALPVAQRSHGKTEAGGKLFLGQPQAQPQIGYVHLGGLIRFYRCLATPRNGLWLRSVPV